MLAYRNSTKIVGDILACTEQTGQQGINTTSLLAKANLSHSRLSRFMENLMGTGLIATKEIDRKNAFVITQKGSQYLKSYQKFSDIAESFGLEL